MSRFAIAKGPAPLLNTPDFHLVFGGTDGESLPLDDQGLLRAVEMVALPGTCFKIQRIVNDTILQVTTDEYPAELLYVDRRFVSIVEEDPGNRIQVLPNKALIIERLLSQLGSPYIWGGNLYQGIPKLLEFYPPKKMVEEPLLSIWMLRGVDCSGLLYEATDGCTPRNTSELVSFGRGVKIAGLNPKQIAERAKPLDLLVWKGHVIIALDSKTCIESLKGKGVILQNLETRIAELGRKPIDEWMPGQYFVMRNWNN